MIETQGVPMEQEAGERLKCGVPKCERKQAGATQVQPETKISVQRSWWKIRLGMNPGVEPTASFSTGRL